MRRERKIDGDEDGDEDDEPEHSQSREGLMRGLP